MTLDPWVLLTIITMTVATYATRAGGYVLFRAFKPSPRVRAMLSYVPGTLFMSYVAPALLDAGPPQWIGSAAAVSIMLLTRQMAPAIFGGTAAAWLVWAYT